MTAKGIAATLIGAVSLWFLVTALTGNVCWTDRELIEGQVVDALTGEPLESVTVELISYPGTPAVTDEDGAFELLRMPRYCAGFTQLRFSSRDVLCCWVPRALTFEPHIDPERLLPMIPSATLRLPALSWKDRLLTADSVSVVLGAWTTEDPLPGQPVFVPAVESRPTCRERPGDPSRVLVTAWATIEAVEVGIEGRTLRRGPFPPLRPGEVRTLEIRPPERPGTIIGSVECTSDVNRDQGSGFACWRNGLAFGSVEISPEGTFEFADVEPGQVDIRIELRQPRVERTDRITVDPGQTVYHDMVMALDRRRIEGRVYDSIGAQPRRHVEIIAESRVDGAPGPFRTTTDEHGHFVFELPADSPDQWYLSEDGRDWTPALAGENAVDVYVWDSSYVELP